MLTERQRIDNLEADLLELRVELRIAGALTINAVAAILDQMVDEQLLPAATRTEIFGRIRSDLRAMRAASPNLTSGANAALPFYRTKDENADLKHRMSQMQKDSERLRKETLRLRNSKPDGDPEPEEPRS